jgi:hypothetical protein
MRSILDRLTIAADGPLGQPWLRIYSCRSAKVKF